MIFQWFHCLLAACYSMQMTACCIDLSVHQMTTYNYKWTLISFVCGQKNNLMQYNVNKCKYMIISRRKQPPLPLPKTSLAVDNAPMDMVSEYKYLGVLLTSSLDWSKHVTRVCKNARQQVGILYRKFLWHCNSSALKQLYLSYVHPHLEYAAPVWDPHQQGLINSLESIQKFALKLCTKNWNACKLWRDT